MRLPAKLLALCLSGLCVTGCMSAGHPIDQYAVSALQRGVTTTDMARKAMGDPQATSSTADGRTIMVYSYTQAQARPETFIPIVGPLVGGADAQGTMVTLIFGADGKLTDHTVTHTQAHTGMHS